MATRGPWSVKGIDSKAREAALQAARSEGVTLGDYLNRLLLEAESEDAQSGPSDTTSPMENMKPEEKQHIFEETGFVPDAQVRGLEAITKLASRIENSENRSTLAISGIEQSLRGAMSRLENAERSQQAIESRIDHANDELRQAQEYLKKRINRLETDDASEQTLHALRTLEGALERLATRVEDQSSAHEASQRAVDERVEGLDAELGKVRSDVDASLEDAASRIEKAVSEAELRSEGRTQHLSDRLSKVEVDVSEASRLTNDRVGKIETEVGSTLGKVSDSVERMSKHVAQNEERSEQAFDLVSRLEEQAEKFRDDIQDRLSGVDTSLDAISERLTEAENLTDTALAGLETSVAQLDERMTREFADDNFSSLRDEFDARMQALQTDLAGTVAQTRSELAEQIEQAASVPTEAFSEMNTAVSEMHKRLRRAEQRQMQSVEAIAEEVARLTETLEKRVRVVEERNESELSSSVRGQISELATTFHKRLNDLETRGSDDSLDEVSAKINELADVLNGRVEASEERSASAIRDFTDHVTTLTKSLQVKQEEGLNRISDEIKQSETRQSDSLKRAVSGVEERISQVESATASTVSPIQKAMASLAERLQAVEDFSSPVGGSGAEKASMSFASFEDQLSQVDDLDEAPAPVPEPKAPASKNEPDAYVVPDDPWANDADAFSPAPVQNESFDAELDEFSTSMSDGGFDLDAAELDDPNDVSADDFGMAESAPALDYLSRAREAARSGSEPKKAAKSSRKKTPSGKGGGSKVPLVAAASVLALTAVGTAGYMMMRGKQDSGIDILNSSSSRGAVDENSIIMPDVSELDETSAAEPLSEDEMGQGELTGDESAEGIASEVSAAEMPAETAAPRAAETATATATSAPAPRAEPEPTVARTVTPEPEVEPAPSVVEDASSVTRSLNQREAAATAPPQQTIAAPVSAPAAPTPIETYQTGVALLDAGRITEGVAQIRSAADAGVAVAQYRLSKLYEAGQGVPRDLTQSREWTARAAESGNVKAMHDLAVFYAEGEGGPLNYAGAVQWFRRAAEHGLVDSQFNLGVLYEQGMGISANPGQALFWFAVAEKSGDSGATPKVSQLSAELDPVVVESALTEAAAFQPQPSDPIANGRFPATQSAPTQTSVQSAPVPESAQTALVREAQALLNDLGYGAGVADGEFGTQTRNAISAFQRANGFPQSVQVTPTLIRQLKAVQASM
ncbi:MAG: hypothetical protein CMK07_14995 [Ponticaulis sp.]|nr:hypothetical protein [Ponticaulis sp.]